MHTCSSGSSGSTPFALIHTSCAGGRGRWSSHDGTSVGRESIGRSRWDHSANSGPNLSLYGANCSCIVGSDSGSATSGIASWCSGPVSSIWYDACRLKIARPCWIATTRRVVKLRPSRIRSTS